MKTTKLVGLVVLGFLIGVFASGSLGAVVQEASGSRRLSVIQVSTPGAQHSYFLQDTKTGGCWLMVRSRDDVSGALAPAPRESCQQ